MRVWITVVAGLVALAASAQEQRQCVNPDIVNGLVFRGRSDLKVTLVRGLPAYMTGIRAPAGFNPIGSGAMPGGESKVAYRTSLTAERAYSALLAAMGAQGWVLEQPLGTAATFNIAGAPRDGVVCRNGERLVVMTAESAGVSYVNISNLLQRSHQECGGPDPTLASDLEMQRAVALQFRFPDGTSLAQGYLSGGGSNDVYTQGLRVISTQTPSALVESLASQIAEQGWRQESNWSGGLSAGSNWHKESEGKVSWATLEILRVSQGTYDVDFTVANPQ